MNKKVLMVVAPKDFRDEEYLEPRQVLEKGGVEIKVVSFKKGRATGVRGLIIPIDLTADEADPADFDGVLFVGGVGMVGLTGDQNFIKLAKDFYNAGKLTAAICIAPLILAKAGILKGRRATVCSGSEEDLTAAGAIYVGPGVIVDGIIVTADGPAAAKEFGEKILKKVIASEAKQSH